MNGTGSIQSEEVRGLATDMRCLSALIAAVAMVLACGSPTMESFDLAAELPFAKVHQSVSELHFGEPETEPRLRQGWQAPEKNRETTWIWASGKRSVLEVFLADRSPHTMVARIEPYHRADSPNQTVTPTVNGHRLQTTPVSPGVTEYRWPLSPEMLRPGINEISFAYAHGQLAPDPKIAGQPQRELSVRWSSLSFESNRPSTPSGHPGQIGRAHV